MIDVDLNAVATPLDWVDLFGRDAATGVEIGSGKGRFLLELATAHPERNFLAVERSGKYHALCCQRAARRGLRNPQIAQALYISPGTVRNHLSAIYRKLGVHSRHEALQIADERHLI